MKRFSVLLLLSFLSVTAIRAQTPPTADAVLKDAYRQAGIENKNVFIIFHASWCGWCHKMDTSINDPACKKFFTDNYVIRHLVVYESKGKEKFENPGALELLTKHGGSDLGIPFWLVFDKDGKLLADSKYRPEGGDSREENSGCPANEKEVEYFTKVLKQTSSMNTAQLEIIRKRFRQNE
jgi:thioredoxin-related protein